MITVLFKKVTGFTLLEIVIVLAIVAAVVVLSFLGVNSIIPDLHLKAAVRNLKSDMHLARLVAIKQNAFIVSQFNPAENSYTLYIDDGGGDDTKINNYCQDPGEKTIKKTRIHSHVNIYHAKFGSTENRFAFNGCGNLDGLSGSVYMQNTIASYRGVTVSRIGKITIKVSRDGQKWHRLR